MSILNKTGKRFNNIDASLKMDIITMIYLENIKIEARKIIIEIQVHILFILLLEIQNLKNVVLGSGKKQTNTEQQQQKSLPIWNLHSKQKNFLKEKCIKTQYVRCL